MLLRPAEQGAGSNSTPGQSGRPAHSPLGGRPSLVRWQIGVPDPRPCCFPEICSRTLSCRCAQQSEAPAQTPAQGSQVGLRFRKAAADPDLFGVESGCLTSASIATTCSAAGLCRAAAPSRARRRLEFYTRAVRSCRSAQQSEAPARILHQGSQVGLRTRPAAAGRRLFGGESTCRTPASAAPQASASGLCRAAAPSRARRRLRLPPRAVR